MMLYAVAVMSMGSLISPIGKDMHASRAQCGILFSANFFGFVLAVVVSGFLGEKIRNRFHIIGYGCIVIFIACCLMWLTHNIVLAGLCFFALGSGIALLQTTASSLCADLNKDSQAHALGVLYTFFAAGAIVGPVISAGIIQMGLDWRYLYTLVAAASIVLGILMFVSDEGERDISGHIKASDLKTILSNSRFVMSCLALLLYVGIETAVWGWMPALVHEKAGLSGTLSAITLSVFWITITIGRIVSAAVVRRFGAALIALALTGICIISISLLGIIDSAWQVWVAVPLIGLTFSAVYSNLLALGTTSVNGSSSAGAGFLIISGGIGGMIVPATAGLVSQYQGFTISVAMLVGLQFMLVWLAYRMRLDVVRCKA